MKIVVKQVTQPVHAADGTVTHHPGQQFGQDEELPEGVWWKYAIADDGQPAPVKRGPGRPPKTAPAGDSAD